MKKIRCTAKRLLLHDSPQSGRKRPDEINLLHVESFKISRMYSIVVSMVGTNLKECLFVAAGYEWKKEYYGSNKKVSIGVFGIIK